MIGFETFDVVSHNAGVLEIPPFEIDGRMCQLPYLRSDKIHFILKNPGMIDEFDITFNNLVINTDHTDVIDMAKIILTPPIVVMDKIITPPGKTYYTSEDNAYILLDRIMGDFNQEDEDPENEDD